MIDRPSPSHPAGLQLRVVLIGVDHDFSPGAFAGLDRAGAYDVNERATTWSEATAPVGGNTDTPFVSTVPESSVTAERPVTADPL